MRPDTRPLVPRLGNTSNQTQRLAGAAVSSHHDEIGCISVAYSTIATDGVAAINGTAVCVRVAVLIGEELVQPMTRLVFDLASQAGKTGQPLFGARRKTQKCPRGYVGGAIARQRTAEVASMRERV